MKYILEKSWLYIHKEKYFLYHIRNTVSGMQLRGRVHTFHTWSLTFDLWYLQLLTPQFLYNSIFKCWILMNRHSCFLALLIFLSNLNFKQLTLIYSGLKVKYTTEKNYLASPAKATQTLMVLPSSEGGKKWEE